MSHIYAGQPAISCHHERPGPGRRKPRQSQRLERQASTAWKVTARKCSNINTNILTWLSVLVLLFSAVAAEGRVHPALQKLARRSELLIDRSPRPEPPIRRMLMERDPKSSSTESPIASFTLVTATGAGAAAAAATQTVDTSKPTSLPQPFDTTLGNNFTNPACPIYFTKFLGDPQFQQCYPFSFLLQV